MLKNAKAQMLCGNNNNIRELDKELIEIGVELSDDTFFDIIDFQIEIIDMYEKKIEELKKQ